MDTLRPSWHPGARPSRRGHLDPQGDVAIVEVLAFASGGFLGRTAKGGLAAGETVSDKI